MTRLKIIAAAFTALVLAGCDKEYDDDKTPPPPPPTVIKASGDLTSSIAQFRTIIGDPVNNTPGQTTGRREINWDGGTPQITNNDAFPLDFFNPTDAAAPNGRKRGLVYTGNNGALRLDSTSFSELETTYADNFKPFFIDKRNLTLCIQLVDTDGCIMSKRTEQLFAGLKRLVRIV